MKNSQLIEILRKLEESDIPEIKKFLESSYLNRSPLKKDTIKLFNFLSKYLPDLPEEKIIKDNVFNQLFPGKSIIEGKIDKISSELSKLLRDFLIFQYFRREEMDLDRQIILLKVYRELEMNDKYKLLEKKVTKTIESELLSLEQLEKKHLLNNEIHLWHSSHNNMQSDLTITPTLESLIAHFEANRIKYANLLLILKLHTDINESDIVNRYLSSEISKELSQKYPIILILSEFNLLLRKKYPVVDDFYFLQNLLNKYEHLLSTNFLKESYTNLRNICTFLIDNKQDHLIKVLHNLQIDNINRGFYYFDNKILPTSLLNITRMASLAQNTTWAMENIEKHKDLIIGEGEEREYYRINKALCFHYQKQYEAALDVLPPICDNIVFYLLARRIEIMCYYDLDSDLLSSKIDAFKVYIRRAYDKGLADTLLDPNKEFINVIMQIISTAPGDKERCLRLLERLDMKGVVSESKWLTAKIKELG